MRVVLEIDETNVTDFMHTLLNEKKRGDEDWYNASCTVDDFIVASLTACTEMMKNPHNAYDEVQRQSNVQDYRVYTDSNTLLYRL